MKLFLTALLLNLCLAGCSRNSDTSSAPKADSKQADSGGKSSGGDQKKQHDPGTVKIEPPDQQKAGIRIAEVETRTMPQLLTVPGQVMMDEQHTSHVGTVADGRITAVYVLPGAMVHRGTVLAELHSHSVHETVGALVQAFAAVDRQRSAVAVAQQTVDRYAHLLSIQAASLEEKQHADQMLAQAKQDLTDAQANVHMEREHLSELLQIPPDSLTPNNLYDRELVPVRSSIDGAVIARNVTVGQVVDTGFEAFTVSNLSSVWVVASVNEKDLALVHNGAKADVITQAYADTAFPAKVAMVGDTLDPQNRTIPVRLAVSNPSLELRPGMFASAHISGTQTRTALFIPEDALQDVNGNQVVFVTQDGSTFRAQVLKLGTRSKGKVEVIEGLKPGDHLAVDGAFMVKGELLKGSVGDE
jgi:cobalt-zinc-cadmium efflux system membrane fusion protein